MMKKSQPVERLGAEELERWFVELVCWAIRTARGVSPECDIAPLEADGIILTMRQLSARCGRGLEAARPKLVRLIRLGIDRNYDRRLYDQLCGEAGLRA